MNSVVAIAWVPALPLAAAVLIGLHMLSGQARGDAAEPRTARVAQGAALGSWLIALALALQSWWQGMPGHSSLGEWMRSGALVVPWSFTLDALGLGFAVLIGLIGWLTLVFSTRYLHREPGFHRFMLAMCLFLAGMLLIPLAGNIGLLFVGWELCGISSYLLIGFAQERPTATGNALRAFVTNRIGDAGLVLAMAAAWHYTGSLDWPVVFSQAQPLGRLPVALIVLGFLIAALAKSAQVPFSPWIARALEGPTPSSAIFYGSLMVHAGVILLARIEPLLLQVPAFMALVFLAGLLTALYGALVGLVQTDIKSTLLFATLTQVGLMFMACGLGWFEWAAAHAAWHAVFRAWQFLSSPSWLLLSEAPPRPAPTWLTRHAWLYRAAQARFWLEELGDWLLTRPTQGLSRDMAKLDERVLARLIGMPGVSRLTLLLAEVREDVVQAHGLVGRLLRWTAERLSRFERRLLLQGGQKPEWMGILTGYLLNLELLLAQPRYLLLLIMATLVVVL